MEVQHAERQNGSVISDADLRHALSVLEVACTFAPDDPQRVALERATVRLVKSAKKKRRLARKRARRAEDVALLSGTGLRRGVADEEIVDEQPAERLHRQRHCYICNAPYRQLHAFYDTLCPACATQNFARRQVRADLAGRRAIITGGRIKIGYHLALKMLRDGADVIITTRFPRDAARCYRDEADFEQWKERLTIYGLDLRDLRGVFAFCEAQLASKPFDILVNNAAQTIRRPPAYYRALAEAELTPLVDNSTTAMLRLSSQESPLNARSALTEFYALCLNASPDEHFPIGAFDIEGKPLDLRHKNSWHLRLHEIEPVEMADMWLVNTMAPFLLATHLKPAMLRSPFSDRYIVNVSAVEGRFDYPHKTTNHAHSNMAKAALNMMTRTAGADYAQDGIYMTSVDPGWITDENPEPMRQHLRQRGFHPPLDVIDGATRVYDPIVRGIKGECLYGVFLKDYEVCSW